MAMSQPDVAFFLTVLSERYVLLMFIFIKVV